jgi:hypothetical protein
LTVYELRDPHVVVATCAASLSKSDCECRGFVTALRADEAKAAWALNFSVPPDAFSQPSGWQLRAMVAVAANDCDAASRVVAEGATRIDTDNHVSAWAKKIPCPKLPTTVVMYS